MVTQETRLSGRKRMSGEDRRSQIIEVAAELFSQNGFKGTTTKQIAESAGVSEAIIFRHFENKQELYRAIIDFKVGESLKQLWLSSEDAMRRKDDRAVFEALATEVLETHRKDPTLLRLLYYSALEGHELSKTFYSTIGKVAQERIAEYIRRRIEDKAFKKMDPVSSTRCFFSLVGHRAVVRELFQDSEWRKGSSREVAAEITNIFLHGIVSDNTVSR